jgi:hypothetical protein
MFIPRLNGNKEQEQEVRHDLNKSMDSIAKEVFIGFWLV